MKERVLKYDQKYKNTAFLFVYKRYKQNSATFLEVKFKTENFLHLTGINTNLKANDFYSNLITNKLSTKQFELTEYTEMKLRALETLLNIDSLNCQIGEYKGNRPYLKADMIMGKYVSIMGLVKIGKFYSPRTVIEEKTENIIKNPQPLLATFKKNLGTGEKYTETYRNLKYDFEKFIYTLPQKALEKIEIKT